MFDGSYSIFDDVAEGGGFDQLKDRASDLAELAEPVEVVKTVTRKPRRVVRKKVESNKNNNVKASVKRGRGRQSGVKGKCGLCGTQGHYKSTCPTA
jgi:hypothetical protein